MTVYFFNVLCYSFNRIKMFTCYESRWQLEPKGRQYAVGSFFIWIKIQYVGISLLAGGVSGVTTILTTIMVNARHLFTAFRYMVLVQMVF